MGTPAEDCIEFLERICWGGTPQCPYCQSTNSTAIRQERRYHCNTCFNSYSVMVGTLFHGSKVPLAKWFRAIHLYLDKDLKIKSLSTRDLASRINVNKNTAASMLKRIRSSLESDKRLLKAILSKRLEDSDGTE
ncbi:IS1595 family transposase [Leptothoe sp. PORK10 BA2]|uniref:IS1595 family transposase n=1 Tax=Leptothoe sp. PORK10 BA2 TaxID=3110254 RepID=UPI002B203935|nr:IS1595 family transposase [Leptothoe sp. PORK10 BA2]